MAREPRRLARGTSGQVAAYTGPLGELIVDTDNKRVHLQDGATAGGTPMAKKAEVDSLASTISSLSFRAPPQGRITPVSGVAIPSAPISGVTSLFYTPSGGRFAPVVLAGSVTMVPFNELTLPLVAAYFPANTLFDLFVFGNPLKFGAAAAPVTTEIVEGLEVNSGSVTLRWGASAGDTTVVPAQQATRVGAFRTALAGETRLTDSNIDIANLFNRVPLIKVASDPTGSWSYASGVWRAVRGGAGPKISFVQVQAGLIARASYSCLVTPASGGTVGIGVGLDSDSPVNPTNLANFGSTPPAFFVEDTSIVVAPARGYHDVRALEYAPSPGGTYFGNGSAILTLELEA